MEGDSAKHSSFSAAVQAMSEEKGVVASGAGLAAVAREAREKVDRAVSGGGKDSRPRQISRTSKASLPIRPQRTSARIAQFAYEGRTLYGGTNRRGNQSRLQNSSGNLILQCPRRPTGKHLKLDTMAEPDVHTTSQVPSMSVVHTAHNEIDTSVGADASGNRRTPGPDNAQIWNRAKKKKARRAPSSNVPTRSPEKRNVPESEDSPSSRDPTPPVKRKRVCKRGTGIRQRRTATVEPDCKDDEESNPETVRGQNRREHTSSNSEVVASSTQAQSQRRSVITTPLQVDEGDLALTQQDWLPNLEDDVLLLDRELEYALSGTVSDINMGDIFDQREIEQLSASDTTPSSEEATSTEAGSSANNLISAHDNFDPGLESIFSPISFNISAVGEPCIVTPSSSEGTPSSEDVTRTGEVSRLGSRNVTPAVGAEVFRDGSREGHPFATADDASHFTGDGVGATSVVKSNMSSQAGIALPTLDSYGREHAEVGGPESKNDCVPAEEGLEQVPSAFVPHAPRAQTTDQIHSAPESGPAEPRQSCTGGIASSTRTQADEIVQGPADQLLLAEPGECGAEFDSQFQDLLSHILHENASSEPDGGVALESSSSLETERLDTEIRPEGGSGDRANAKSTFDKKSGPVSENDAMNSIAISPPPPPGLQRGEDVARAPTHDSGGSMPEAPMAKRPSGNLPWAWRTTLSSNLSSSHEAAMPASASAGVAKECNQRGPVTRSRRKRRQLVWGAL